MDPEGKVSDERTGVAQPFIFTPTETQVIAALEEIAQDFLELREAFGKKAARQGQRGALSKIRRGGWLSGPDNDRGDDQGEDDQPREDEEEPAGRHGGLCEGNAALSQRYCGSDMRGRLSSPGLG